MNLTDKICIITGGASGIGMDIARTFAEAGGKIVIADIDIDAANKAARDLGDGHMGVDMDVADVFLPGLPRQLGKAGSR